MQHNLAQNSESSKEEPRLPIQPPAYNNEEFFVNLLQRPHGWCERIIAYIIRLSLFASFLCAFMVVMTGLMYLVKINVGIYRETWLTRESEEGGQSTNGSDITITGIVGLGDGYWMYLVRQAVPGISG
ncbi:hypothetical protein V490_04334 [Pseudogymnoascus sp. VKM F-3557]|nr:hypothetical protein V490_04334 [Pseudogymnoascus sp. VKM F-3557]